MVKSLTIASLTNEELAEKLDDLVALGLTADTDNVREAARRLRDTPPTPPTADELVAEAQRVIHEMEAEGVKGWPLTVDSLANALEAAVDDRDALRIAVFHLRMQLEAAGRDLDELRQWFVTATKAGQLKIYPQRWHAEWLDAAMSAPVGQEGEE